MSSTPTFLVNIKKCTKDQFNHSNILVIGTHGSGKSVFTNHLDAFILSGQNMTESVYDIIIDQQERQITVEQDLREGRVKGVTIAFDGYEEVTKQFEDKLHDTLVNGKHYLRNLVFLCQKSNCLPPKMRAQLDYVVLFRTNNVDEQKQYYERYAKKYFRSFENFKKCYMECTEDFKCMVIKQGGLYVDENIFWYKVDMNKNNKNAEEFMQLGSICDIHITYNLCE